MTLSKNRLAELKKLSESKIDYSDIPETDASFWKNAHIFHPHKKRRITIRIDEDTLDWFKKLGEGYQARINSVLHAYVSGHQKSSRRGLSIRR
jgi:uncharacterized protein (DUF4415 family)